MEIESVAFPQSQLAPPRASIDEDVEVVVVGNHPKSGRYGFIENVGDLDREGNIKSYHVQFPRDPVMYNISALNLKR